MNCHQFEILFTDYLEGRLTTPDRSAAEAHLATCPACRALVTPFTDASSSDPTPDAHFIPDVLGRTSGSACGRAEGMLSDFVDGGLRGMDAGLLVEHLEHCASCRELAELMVELAQPVREMGEIDPGPAFTDEVLGVTSRFRPRPVPWAVRWRARWQALQARPRFTLEAAYAGTLLLVLLFGTSISPLRDVPPRALALAQTNPLQVVTTLSPESPVVGPVVGATERAWEATGGRAYQAVADGGAEVATRFRHGRVELGAVGEDGVDLSKAIFRGDVTGAGTRFKKLGGDLTRLWNVLLHGVAADSSMTTGQSVPATETNDRNPTDR